MAEIDQAVQILRNGGLVAFPTETVYGLGADATNEQAIKRIFAAKGRPSTNPLIVHIADIPTAKKFAATWPPSAQLLAEKFWPGPLTLILPKSPAIVDQVTAGKSTVGLRIPNHP
ncbi:MAG TPA: L-threonylcarbamoyladenylate synthase, partial [Tepidisphaeraceae bacterium]|nr:L-threonylcarbamoyladenylate synthase [Tepidisphaeraceae bacterium]